MKIFVIHSGSDREIVKEKLMLLENSTVSSEILMLKNGGKLWKLDAKKMIAQAQIVLLFVGKKTYESPNIEWEIKTAQKASKPIFTILLADDNELPSALFIQNKFTRENENYGKTKTLNEVTDLINAYDQGDYALFNGKTDEIDTKTLLEQYKIFLQTSETLVARRQSVNNFYITVNSALVSLYGIAAALSLDMLIKGFIVIVFALVGVILCVSWIRILNAYGILNASKMKIISLIERQLPASLYDAEWRAQSDKLNKRPYVSFTSCEIRIPKIFICVYCVLTLCIIATTIISFVV